MNIQQINTMHRVAVCGSSGTADICVQLRHILEANQVAADIIDAAEAVPQQPIEMGVLSNLEETREVYDTLQDLFAHADVIIVNVDDKYGRWLLADCEMATAITYSLSDDTADYTAHGVEQTAQGVRFEMVGRGFIQRIRLTHTGDDAVRCALAATAAAIALGVGAQQAVAALE